MRRITTLAIGILLVTGTLANASSEKLSIRPVMQETPEWCWLAVGQMIFEHFNIRAVNPSDYQCGIIAFWGARQTPSGWQGPCMNNCYRCPLPAGSFTTIQAMLSQYPRMAGDQPLAFRSSGSPIDTESVKDEIDNERPILIGITPSGARLPVSQHVALLVGYDEEAEGLYVFVNDPFPYRAYGIDPFVSAGGRMVQAGQYRIRYEALRSRLVWRETIYGFQQ